MGAFKAIAALQFRVSPHTRGRRLEAMDMRVKVCGLSTLPTLEAALEAGAAYVGLVWFAKSPRHVTLEAARSLAARARGRAKVVSLVVDASDTEIAALVERVVPDMLQLHGKETPERVAAIRALSGTPVMKAVAVETAADAARALDYRSVCDYILFDAKAPKGSTLPGGNGVAFDWRALSGVTSEIDRWMLSGGLTAENVSAAIRLTGAKAVDVSSGVESAPGVKDVARIRAFIDAATSASGA